MNIEERFLTAMTLKRMFSLKADHFPRDYIFRNRDDKYKDYIDAGFMELAPDPIAVNGVHHMNCVGFTDEGYAIYHMRDAL